MFKKMQNDENQIVYSNLKSRRTYNISRNFWQLRPGRCEVAGYRDLAGRGHRESKDIGAVE